MSDTSLPKVSVCMITYNHEKFIAQAIESVLMQQTDFPIELIIGEDCSTDGTAAIVRDYAEKYPEIIVAIIREKNIGAKKNSLDVKSRTKGEYLALLEGDDYWTDPLKLQKQVEFIESNPGCVACGGIAQIVDEDGKYTGMNSPNKLYPELINSTIIADHYIHTSTLLYKKEAFDYEMVSDWWETLPVGDTPLQIMLSLKGAIGFKNETLSCYRHQRGGVHSSLSYLEKINIFIDCFEILQKKAPKFLIKDLSNTKHRGYVLRIIYCFKEKKYISGITYFLKYYFKFPHLIVLHNHNFRWILFESFPFLRYFSNKIKNTIIKLKQVN